VTHDPGIDIPRDHMLTTDEVAKLLRITPQRVRQKALLGEIPRHKMDGRVLFAPEDIRAYIDARREGST
jgi:excisionase family DNA binding protein